MSVHVHNERHQRVRSEGGRRWLRRRAIAGAPARRLVQLDRPRCALDDLLARLDEDVSLLDRCAVEADRAQELDRDAVRQPRVTCGRPWPQ